VATRYRCGRVRPNRSTGRIRIESLLSVHCGIFPTLIAGRSSCIISVTFTATIRDIATATTDTITMTWDGSTFVRR